MSVTLDKIKAMYKFKVLDVLRGEETTKKGKCSTWVRRKELKNDKDLVYLKLQVEYAGEYPIALIYLNFYIEDSEGYFNKCMPPEDYLEKAVSQFETVEGGLLFSVYKDTASTRLWFDTGMCYESSRDPIFIDIALPSSEVETRTQFFEQEELAQTYTQEMAIDLDSVKMKPCNETETIIREIAVQCGIPHKKIANGYILKILLPGGRKQNVIVNFTGKDKEGNDLLTIGTICAPVGAQKNNYIFLKMNPKMVSGAVGISSIRGEEYYVVTDTFPVSALNKEVILYAIRNIAAKGDWLEIKLTGGKDIQ